MIIRQATVSDLDALAALRVALWPDETHEAHRAGAEDLLAEPERYLVLMAEGARGDAVAFAEASIRRDYVNGCETSPVLFLEGIHTAPELRRQGLAQGLVSAAAAWGRERGCQEFASDAFIDNDLSHRFHTAIGFEETERVVYFRRPL